VYPAFFPIRAAADEVLQFRERAGEKRDASPLALFVWPRIPNSSSLEGPDARARTGAFAPFREKGTSDAAKRRIPRASRSGQRVP